MIGFFLQKKYATISVDSFLKNSTNYDIRSAPPSQLVLDHIAFDNPISWISSSHLGHIFHKIKKKIENEQHRDVVSWQMLQDIVTRVD